MQLVKYFLGTLVMTCLAAFTFSQPPNREGLFKELDQINVNDSTKAVLYNTIARTYVREQKDSAIYYFREAIDLANSQKAHLLEVNTLSFLSMTYAIYGNNDSAKVCLLDAEQICKNNTLDSALHQVYFGLGNVVESAGDLTGALDYYLSATKYFESNKMHKSANRAKANMSYIYMKTDDLDKAYQLIKESNAYYAGVGANRQLMNGYSRLGTIFSMLNQYDSSMFYANKALVIAEELEDQLTSHEIRLNLANAQFNTKDYQSAQQNFEHILPFLENSSKNPGNLINTYSSLMVCNMLTGAVQKAQNYEVKADQMIPKVTEYIDLMGYYQKKFMKDSIQGNLSGSIAHYQKYIQLKDSLFNKEKASQLAELQTKYETEKVAAEKLLAENRAELAESESQRNLFLFVGAITLAIMIVLAAVFYNSKLKQSKKAEIALLELKSSQKQLALEKQYRDSELKALKAQMNPHFIFNVLNSIQEFIIMNQKDLASDYLATFAELIRSYLHFSNKGYISLREETETLEKYLELEALRFGDGFIYAVNLNKNLQPDEFKLPTMIIQPYVENAIKHGLFSKKGERKLEVSFESLEEGILLCSIIDNGIGREAAMKIKESKNNMHPSFAMEATSSRLDLFNQRSHQKIGVEVIDLIDEVDQPSGTQVKLTIPSQS